LQPRKDSKAAHLFANNDGYRKENVISPLVGATKSNYRGNNNQYQNQVKIKGQPMNVAMQDGYFPGFYPKPPAVGANIHHQPTDVAMFAKHELEFHPKNMSTPQQLQQQSQQQQQQQFPPFHAATQKYDMHEYDHNILKNDVNHKIVSGNSIHVARPPLDFPQNQMYYNENNAQNTSHNQYYPNEFDIGGGGSDGANSITATGNGNAAGYFDPKSQEHYYNMNYHHHAGNAAGNAAADYSDMYGPNALNENCENFASFQQYYDQQQQQQPQTHHQQLQQQNMHQAHHQHPHYPPHHHLTATAAVAQQTAYVHHQQQHQQQQQQNFLSQQLHGNASLTENSNSSSDFNFLSNLNDFAPEYYQLS
jgi:hypothetical protein